MNDKLNFIDERQKRRYEKVLQKTGEEYLQEIAILKSREDFLEEYEYFLQLLDSPFSARKLQMRVENHWQVYFVFRLLSKFLMRLICIL